VNISATDPSSSASSILSLPVAPCITAIVALNEAHNMYGVKPQGGSFTLRDDKGRETVVVVEKPVIAEGNCWECWVDEKIGR
jgi:hypothetical protein